MKSFNLPDLGEGLAESEIVQWHINIGDYVEVDQVVLTVETAKATVEVPAPYSGTIINRYGEAGDVIGIGSLLLEIEESTAPVAKTNVAATTESQTKEAQQQKSDAATVVGTVHKKATISTLMSFGWVIPIKRVQNTHLAQCPLQGCLPKS